jgi:hypothetical protein
MNSAGNASCSWTREIRATPLSSGSRSASSAPRANSGSSSKNSTPRCASEISPGAARAAADERLSRRRVMRRAKRRRQRRFRRTRLARDRRDARDAQHLVLRQRRQQAAQALGEHALAAARRADHQQVVSARGRDDERALGKVWPRTSAISGDEAVVTGSVRAATRRSRASPPKWRMTSSRCAAV